MQAHCHIMAGQHACAYKGVNGLLQHVLHCRALQSEEMVEMFFLRCNISSALPWTFEILSQADYNPDRLFFGGEHWNIFSLPSPQHCSHGCVAQDRDIDTHAPSPTSHHHLHHPKVRLLTLGYGYEHKRMRRSPVLNLHLEPLNE